MPPPKTGKCRRPGDTGHKKSARGALGGVMIDSINGTWFAALLVQHPEKRKAPDLDLWSFSAKRTISRNGRCVGINCRGICDPLQSKWRDSPARQHRSPFHTSVHAVCVNAPRGWLTSYPDPRSRFRFVQAVGNRPEWERGESEPRAKTGLAPGGDATMNLLTVSTHLVSRAGKRPTTDRR